MRNAELGIQIAMCEVREFERVAEALNRRLATRLRILSNPAAWRVGTMKNTNG